jgi:hypothetical protein
VVDPLEGDLPFLHRSFSVDGRNEDTMKKALVAVARFLATTQRVVIEFLRRIPGSQQVEGFADIATRPIRNLASFFLRKFPGLKRWEWLLEIDRLQKIHPTMLLVLLVYVFYRGTQTTYLGHIATDMVIYPFLGAISYFNPFLGILSAVAFGIGDLLQKLVFNDIYGSVGTGQVAALGAYGDANYWGGIVGYCIAYSSIVMAGLVPGMMARVFRLAARKMLAFFFFRKTAAVADGATPGNSGAGGSGSGGTSSLMPGGSEPTYPVAEFVASILGAGMGGAGVMYGLAPTMEAPAFLLRPNPDYSCHDVEVASYLKRPAFRQGIGGPAGGGPVISGLVPVTGPAGPDTPPGLDEPPDGEGPPDGWEPPDDPDPPRNPRTGEVLVFNDGTSEGGKAGDVWYEGQWMDPADAALLIATWEKNYKRERNQWFDKETKQWQEDVARKNREDGYDYDRYRDAWREPPKPAEVLEIPEEDPDVLKLQKRKGDPGFLHRMFVGPSDVGYEKLNQRFDQLDGMQKDLQSRYRDLAAGQKAAEEAGDKWLAAHYKDRRKTERGNFFRIRDAKLDLAGRVTDSSKGGTKYRKYLEKNTTVTWGKAGQATRELLWDPVKHIFKPHLADKDGNGPLGTTFKKLEKASNAMKVRARQMPRIDSEFDEAMDAVRLYGEQLKDAVRRNDPTAIRVIEEKMNAERHRAVTLNHFRGDLANKTRDWEVSAARVEAQYYQTQMDRAGSGQAQFQIGRAGSRVAAKLSGGAFSADAPVIRSRSVKGEAEAWDRLHKQHPEEFRKIRQKMAGDAGGGGGGGGGGSGNLSKYDQMLDQKWTQQQMVAGRKVGRWNDNHVRLEQAEMRLKQAQRSGTSQDVSEAMAAKLDAERRLGRSVNRGLSDPHVKMQMKKAPSDVQQHWGKDAQKFRTDPVKRTTVDIINKEKPWVVETAPGQYRRLNPDDLESVSGHGKAGMDLDLNPNSRIIDSRTLQRVPDAKLQSTVNQACKKLRIDAGRQDIHVVSGRHPAAYRVPAGMDPDDVLQPGHVRDAGPMDGEHMKRVSEWKRTQETGGDLSAKCYNAQKDYRRFTEPMLERHPTARRPAVFNKEAMQIIDDVGNHRMSPGTGNARFKKITGMDLDEGCRKLNSLQEAVPALDSPARRIEIARSRGARTPRLDTPEAPSGTGSPDLRTLVGDRGPTPKTPGGKKINDYLQKRDIRSFVDQDGKVHGFGRKPTPELTNTREAAGIRADARGAAPRGAVKSGKPFEDLLDDARGQNPGFKATHDKVQNALSEGSSKRIEELGKVHVQQMKKEGIWGEPDSPSFKKEVGDRLKISPLDDPRTVQHQQRALYEHGVTETEFDGYIDGRAKIRRGEPVGPMEPVEPLDPTKTRVFIDVDRRVGAQVAEGPPTPTLTETPPPTPSPGPDAPTVGGSPGTAGPPTAPSQPPMPPQTPPSPGAGTGVGPDPASPAPTSTPLYGASEPLGGSAGSGAGEGMRPEYTPPEYTPPDASRGEAFRPEATRPEFEIPELVRPEWMRPEPPQSRFSSRFGDFFPDTTGGGG